jgi:hypothetical protein
MDPQFEVMTIKELETALAKMTQKVAKMAIEAGQAELAYLKLADELANIKTVERQLMWAIMTRKVELEGLKGNPGS